MDCPICKRLERTLESRRSAYIGASSSAYYRVSTRLAAYENVEMERAKSDLQDHLQVCLSVAEVGHSGPGCQRANHKTAGQ